MIDLGMLQRQATDALPFLTSLLVGGALISLFGLAVRKAAARSSAAQRHLILAASMLGLLLLPIIQTIGPELRLEILPAAASATVPDAPVMERSSIRRGSATPSASNASVPPAVAEGSSATAWLSPASSIRLLYLAGIIVVLVPLIAGSFRMRWLVRRARPMPEEHELLGAVNAGRAGGTIQILTSESIRVPLAWGWRKSILLLPEDALDWPREMRRDAIIHELAHLERHDLFFQTIGRIAVGLHWFNPLAWIVLHRLLLEAEQACDDRVIEAGTGTADYAERLLKIAAGANHPALRRLSAVAMARSSQLATRIEALFETTRARSARMGRIRTLSTFVAILTPALLIGAVQVDARSAVDDPGNAELHESQASSVERGQSPANDEAEWEDNGDTDDVEWDDDGDADDVDWDDDGDTDEVDWDDDGDADESPLYAAIRRGNRPMVEYLLDGGADPNARWDGDGNPLMIAVRHARHDIVDLLLARGARPDEGVEGDGNALIVAASRGDLRSLERFIATGADIDRGVPGDGNPLIAASGEGQIEAMKLLIRYGADLEVVVPGDENALITAAQEGQLEAVRYLVTAGADVNSRVPVRSWRTGEIEIRTPLSMAQRKGHREIVRYLRSAGAHE